MADGPSVIQAPRVTVDHEEEDGSPRETISLSEFSATRILLCAWEDRIRLSNQLIGRVRALGGSGRSLVLTLPQEYPHQEGVFVSAVQQVEGFGSVPDIDTKVKRYVKARLTVQYEAATISFGGSFEPLVEESLEPAAEFLTTSNEELFWDSAGTQPVSVGDSPGIQIPFLDWVFNIKNIPSLPPATLNIGFVNDAPLVSRTLGLEFDTETLLYSSVHPKRIVFGVSIIGSAGAPGGGILAGSWDVTYRFTHNIGGWNKFRRGPESFPVGMFRKVGQSFVPVKPYPTMNLTAITGLLYAG